MASMAQPPSGGCVLKLLIICKMLVHLAPAAFGRLCVETHSSTSAPTGKTPAAFGRLCVETLHACCARV